MRCCAGQPCKPQMRLVLQRAPLTEKLAPFVAMAQTRDLCDLATHGALVMQAERMPQDTERAQARVAEVCGACAGRGAERRGARLLDGRADGGVADVGVDLAQELAPCARAGRGEPASAPPQA